MQHGRPPRQPPHGQAEPLKLRFRGAVLALGRVKLGVATLEVRRVEQVRQGLHVVPAHAAPPHAGIDLEVERAAARPARDPGGDGALVPQRRREPLRAARVEQVGAGRREDEHRARDTGGAQLGALLDRGDAVAPGIERLERPRNGNGSHPVRVRLDDREEPRARHTRDGAGVFDDRGEVHFDPGARVAPAR